MGSSRAGKTNLSGQTGRWCFLLLRPGSRGTTVLRVQVARVRARGGIFVVRRLSCAARTGGVVRAVLVLVIAVLLAGGMEAVAPPARADEPKRVARHDVPLLTSASPQARPVTWGRRFVP
jgi:hypothetical protein